MVDCHHVDTDLDEEVPDVLRSNTHHAMIHERSHAGHTAITDDTVHNVVGHLLGIAQGKADVVQHRSTKTQQPGIGIDKTQQTGRGIDKTADW